jgi:diguanylate cyclase (GGDEF)-like protein/PAS domain S-box-containing protein
MRRAPIKAIFNTGQVLLSTAAGSVVYGIVAGPAGKSLDGGEILGALLGTLAIAYVSRTTVVSMISYVTSTSWATNMRLPWQQIVAWLGAAVLGASFTVLANEGWWGFVLGTCMVVFLQRAYTSQLAEVTARRRSTQLRSAVAQLRGSHTKAEIEQTLHEAVKELLGAQRAELAPAPGEMPPNAEKVPVGSEHVLIAEPRRGAAAWTEQDFETLRTLAGVADDALRGADLFSRLKTITDAQNEAVIAFDAQGLVTFVNPAARQMLRYSPDEELKGRPIALVCHLFDRVQPINLTALLRDAVSVEDGDAVLENARGQRLEVAYSFAPLAAGELSEGAVLVMRDVTERRALQAALSHRALHDELTGMPNRRLFLDRLDHALDRSLSNGARHGVLFIDCDRFKLVNDTFGHLLGDQLLVQLSERLLRSAKAHDTVARLSGDEFILLIEDCSDVSSIKELAQHLSEDLRRPYLVDGHTIMLTVSIGVTLTAPGQAREDVMHAADAASYQAKADGRNCVRIATPSLIEATRTRLDMESRLRSAINAEQLQLWYQPIVETRTRRLYGVEALVRWEESDGSIIMPDQFIPIAEDSGLIVMLGRWVLEEACRTAVRWNTEHPDRPALNVSVNLSALQLAQPQLADEVAEVLALTGLPPSQLCIEITETAVFADMNANVRALIALRDIGVLVAVDDFGTGYSSLAYLRKLPVDIVKLDATFIAGLGDDPVDAQIVGSVLRLCKALNRRTVAEGVETEMQWQTLTRMGCPSMQGYLVSRPLRVAAFEAYWDAEQGLDDGLTRLHA